MNWSKRLPVFTYLFIALSVVWGCSSDQKGPGDSGDNNPENAVRIVLDSPDDDRLIAFYFGSYLGQNDQLSDLVVFRNDFWWMLKPKETNQSSHVEALFQAAGDDGELNWGELENELYSAYYDVRQAPASIELLKAVLGDWNNEEWFSHELNGQMTAFKRRLSVKKESIWAALATMDGLSSDVVYPIGTAFIGEHFDKENLVETTVMLKRQDSYWDYFAYGKGGLLSKTIKKEPDDLKVPTQCVGCHFGDKQFEPERSFPREARPGPRGIRSLYVSENLKNESIARGISEHAKRSDNVLGLYATLFLSDLSTRIRKGASSEREQALAKKLGILDNSN